MDSNDLLKKVRKIEIKTRALSSQIRPSRAAVWLSARSASIR